MKIKIRNDEQAQITTLGKHSETLGETSQEKAYNELALKLAPAFKMIT